MTCCRRAPRTLAPRPPATPACGVHPLFIQTRAALFSLNRKRARPLAVRGATPGLMMTFQRFPFCNIASSRFVNVKGLDIGTRGKAPRRTADRKCVVNIATTLNFPSFFKLINNSVIERSDRGRYEAIAGARPFGRPPPPPAARRRPRRLTR
ncbi:hypothetical protein EVAR_18861_1 [Eumeta japonica]|uniref:Uncharacterized protein n=1 Tax=Eumeta variegata TaxID=151549 RepID=A0A4C1UNG2_EUMVA|nr:hypothetical protein EVAR_18861_1 [Eumeta japonica]